MRELFDEFIQGQNTLKVDAISCAQVFKVLGGKGDIIIADALLK